MFVDDSSKPDFQISWENPDTKEIVISTIYTYGSDRLIAIAAFKVLRPAVKILSIDGLGK